MRLCSACATLMFIATSVLAADTHNVQTSHSDQIPVENQPASAPCKGKANRIVVYSASWCRPCQKLKTVTGSLENEGYDVIYRDVDTDIDQLKYKYTALPTIFFLCGEAVIKKETGYRSKAHIKKTLVLDETERQWDPSRNGIETSGNRLEKRSASPTLIGRLSLKRVFGLRGPRTTQRRRTAERGQNLACGEPTSAKEAGESAGKQVARILIPRRFPFRRNVLGLRMAR